MQQQSDLIPVDRGPRSIATLHRWAAVIRRCYYEFEMKYNEEMEECEPSKTAEAVGPAKKSIKMHILLGTDINILLRSS